MLCTLYSYARVRCAYVTHTFAYVIHTLVKGKGRNYVDNDLWPNPFAFTFNLLTYWLNVYHIHWVMIIVHILFAVKYNLTKLR